MRNNDLSVYDSSSPAELLPRELLQTPSEDSNDASVQRYLGKKKRKSPVVNATRYQDPVVTLANLADATGSVSDDFQQMLFKQLAPLVPPGMDQEAFLNSALAAMHGSQPRDELEGMLSAQLFCLHSLVMRMMGRACNAEFNQIVDMNVKITDKLLRAFRETVDTLQRYKGKGSKQQVIVRHVHIHEGAQAIVGNVNQPGEGGEMKKIEDEPQIPCKAVQAMQSAPRCYAKNRHGEPCLSPAIRGKERCRFHGGLSTGPRTPEGLERSRKANWKHGYYSEESQALRALAKKLARPNLGPYGNDLGHA